MTTIHPETQIVASRFDPMSRVCSYTYRHADGSQYTVDIPIADLLKQGNRENRRRHLVTRIINHVQSNPPDAVAENG